MSNPHRLTRRDFLKLAGVGTAGAVVACGRNLNRIAVPGSGATALPTGTAVPGARVTVLPPGTAVPGAAATALPPGTTADTLLVNGRILTVDPANSIVQAIAIHGDKILMTGSDDSIRSLAASNAKIIDLKGRTVTPGFIDPHLHFRVLGLQNVYYTPFMPPDVKDVPSLQRALADMLKSKKSGEWVMGYYLALTDKSIPTKEDLDPVSKNNPVFIMHIGGHWGTANSVALQIAKISNSTPSPQGGIIEKVNGELTGVFYNHRAMDMLRAYAPPIGIDLVRKAILDTQNVMASCGVTSFHDNNIRELDHIQAYQELSQEGKLFLRNDLYLTLEWPSDMDNVAKVKPMDSDVTRFAGYKFLIDGQGPTAYCYQPTNGVEYRMPTWDPQMFKDNVRILHDTGLQICVHCIGDAATGLTLEAFEAAMNANPRPDPRHRIEHAVLTAAQSTQKMKDLGVVVSTQPAFIYVFGEGWQSLFGEERMDRILVTREWIDAGVHVAIGSDAPSTPLYNPQATLAGAMSRFTIKQRVIGSVQVLTFEEALRAHTYEGAYAGHQENVKGTLEADKFADLVVWPDDPVKMSLGELTKLKTVDLTMVGGKVVFEKG